MKFGADNLPNDPVLLKAMGGPNIQSGVDEMLDGIERALARGTQAVLGSGRAPGPPG